MRHPSPAHIHPGPPVDKIALQSLAEGLTPRPKDPKMDENQIGREVVDAAVKIHAALGPGLLETVHEVVLAKELQRRGLKGERQVAVSIEFAGMKFNEGFRADIVVEGKVLLELKAVEQGPPPAALHLPEAARIAARLPAQFRSLPHERRDQTHDQRAGG